MDAVVEAIHAGPIRTAMVITGAGASALSALTAVPGCSQTLVHAEMPYSDASSQKLLDVEPKRRVQCDVGVELAHVAYCKALSLLEAEGLARRTNAAAATLQEALKPVNGIDVIGLGCTASISSSRQSKEGEDPAVCVTCWHANGATNYAARLPPGKSRAEHETFVGQTVIYALAQFDPAAAPLAETLVKSSGITIKAIPAAASEPVQCLLNHVTTDEPNTVATTAFPACNDPFSLIINGKVKRVLFNSHGLPRHGCAPHTEEAFNFNRSIYLLVPGSFNPLHWGHTELARVASNVVTRWHEAQWRRAGGNDPRKRVVVTYEISATIVDKRDLRESDLASRVQQFTESGLRVTVTTARLFVEKARMFPNHGLVVGIDTAERVLNPKYYGDSLEEMKAALQEIRNHGCFFVVGGRLKQADEDGSASESPMTLRDSFSDVPEGAVWADSTRLKIPDGFSDMFVGIAKEDFRVDISSTELRARRHDVKEMKLYVDVERIYNEIREMGVGEKDPLTVEQLLPFDQYHYFGTDTVDAGVRRAQAAAPGKRILDVGSGLGGPARYIAKTHGAHVTAIELQADVSNVAADLTKRCGLSDLITHKAADFMAPDSYYADPVVDPAHAFDAVVSWLVFVHISDRATLLKRCFNALKPGGWLFVEDFHQLGAFTTQELHQLNHDVHCSYLPTLAEFEQQCSGAGFVDIEVQDLSKEATEFANNRMQAYEGGMQRHERVHGKDTARGMLHFYKVIAALFNGGKFGLCRVLARRPEQ